MNYNLKESRISGYKIKLDANENPYPHSPKVLEGLSYVLKNSELIARYPHQVTLKLNNKIAEHHAISDDMILVGTGSKELIEVVYKLFLNPDDVVLLPNPSLYSYEASASICHGRVIKYELNRDLKYDIKSILEYEKIYSPKVLMIGNPNNPTGTVIGIDLIEELLKKVKCPVIIDETYAEFDEISAVNLVEKYDNLIISRTFAKAYGLAGLKIGYLIASPEMIALLKIGLQQYEVSSFAQHMAILVLEDLPYYKNNIEKIRNTRENFANKLRDYSFIDKIYDSSCNFILVKCADERLLPYLLKNSILVRNYNSEDRLKNHLRFSIGTNEDMTSLVEVLDKFMQNIENEKK